MDSPPTLDTEASTKSDNETSVTNGVVEVGKEAKEKKERTSWMKTLGKRTLRLRKSTTGSSDSSKSRLSMPTFSSLDRPSKKVREKDKGNLNRQEEESEQRGSNSSSGGGLDSFHTIKKSSTEGRSKASSNTGAATGIENAVTPNAGKLNASTKPDKGLAIFGIGLGSSSANSKTSAPKDKTDPGSGGLKVKPGSSSVDPKAVGQDGEISSDKQDPSRFLGEGLTFKGKLIGVLEVSGPRGDRICQEALSELKMAVKAAGEHKQKITIHIALDGLRIRDEKTVDCLYHHQVHKISFIAQDLTDTRAFGYIFGSPDTGHRFFGIKTEKSASQVVIAMRDLFQVVFDLKKKEIERAKQQLELQQKFLATRAQETAPPTKSEQKFSIAETYIEGACALGAPSSMIRHTAPEVDLLNLEVELTSLQEGLDSIHHNLAESTPFRGSTASISSDPLNPMPKRASLSSSHTNTTTPVPGTFTNVNGDPFGDSFDPYFGAGGSSGRLGGGSGRWKLGQNSNISQASTHSHQNQTVSCDNSALASPFSADPFAQVDPFQGTKFPGDSDFFSSDPFDSPSGPFSFSFPTDPSSANVNKVSDKQRNSNNSLNPSPIPTGQQPLQASSTLEIGCAKKIAEWTASFEDNFVPECKVGGSGPRSESFAELGPKPGLDMFVELDPLGAGRTKPFQDRKEFFQELKTPPKKLLNELNSSDNCATHNNSQDPAALAKGGQLMSRPLVGKSTDLPNSFSTNFSSGGPDSFTSVVSRPSGLRSSFERRSESPPNYSPPPPPRIISSSGGTGSLADTPPSNLRNNVLTTPTSSNSLYTSNQILSKKSPHILKQMTIAESSFSPKTLPSSKSSIRYSKQLSFETSLKDDIPSLSPPPRPPHTLNSTFGGQCSTTAGGTLSKVGTLSSSALPRPTSGTSGGGDRGQRKSSESSGSVINLPPEPPPRPLQTTSVSMVNHQSPSMQIPSAPPPLPPKKQVANTLSHPVSFKGSHFSTDFKTSFGGSNRASVVEPNDLPLPLPLRKTHGRNGSSVVSDQQPSTVGGRYPVPSASCSGSPALSLKRDNGSIRSNSSIDSAISNGSEFKLTMEQALAQVASLSLGDLAGRLHLPVDKLSSLTIQQLAERLTEMEFEKRQQQFIRKTASYQLEEQSQDVKFGFDDDFSTGNSVPSTTRQYNRISNNSNNSSSRKVEYDRYAVFRELAVEDASGFSLGDSCNSFNANDSEEEDQSRTLDKTLTRDSSSERTLQANGPEGILAGGGDHGRGRGHKTSVGSNVASICSNLANTMDDVTDVNLSDDQDQDGKFPLDDDEDLNSAAGFMNKPEWATFESNFQDQFATTVLVKAEGGAESPWESDEEEKVKEAEPPPQPRHSFNLKPFETPVSPSKESYGKVEQIVYKSAEVKPRARAPSPTDHQRVLGSPSQFQRQSSGSSRHSERSSGGGAHGGGRNSDYSDSGRRPREVKQKYREREWERGELGGGGPRSDSRTSYSSMSRKYSRNGGGGKSEGEEEYGIPSTTSRRVKGGSRPGSGKRREGYENKEEDLEDEEDDRSYVSHPSVHSTSRRHRRYPHKHHSQQYSRPVGGSGSGHRRGERGLSPEERYSNHESNDDSFEEDQKNGPRKRDHYVREKEYYERHYHRSRPTSSGTNIGGGKRHSRDSPRTLADSYRRRDRRGRRPEDDYNDSREFSDYSGEDEGPPYGHSGGYHHQRHADRHGHGRRLRGKRSQYRDREYRDSPKQGHYYTNSPSWDSESNPEQGEREGGPGSREGADNSLPPSSLKSRRPASARHEVDHRRYGRGSPEFSKQSEGQVRRASASGGTPSRRYQSELALNSSQKQSQKLTPFNVEDDFGGTREDSTKPCIPGGWDETLERIESPRPGQRAELVTTVEEVGDLINYSADLPVEKPTSPFQDDCFLSSAETGREEQNGGFQPDVWEPPKSGGDKEVDLVGGGLEDTLLGPGNGGGSLDVFPPVNETKVFTFSGRRLESIKSEEEKSNDDSHSASESALHMKKSDSFNIFKHRVDDPFGDDDFFA